jgi:RHS repeat-associated protein
MLYHPTSKLSNGSHPFGSVMNGRSFSNENYRFGFNNQEQDKGLGEYYAFEYRIHDARLGRFLSVDPLAPEYPWNSTYAFAENSVICCIDIEGLEVFFCADGSKLGKLGDNQQIRVVNKAKVESLAPRYHKKTITIQGRSVVVNDVNKPIKYKGNEKYEAGKKVFNAYLQHPNQSNIDPILPDKEGSKEWFISNSNKINLMSNEADIILTSMATEINGGTLISYSVQFDNILDNGSTSKINQAIKLDQGNSDYENYYSTIKTLFHEYQHYLDQMNGTNVLYTPIRHAQIEIKSLNYAGKENLSYDSYNHSKDLVNGYLTESEDLLKNMRLKYISDPKSNRKSFNTQVKAYEEAVNDYNRNYGENRKSKNLKISE